MSELVARDELRSDVIGLLNRGHNVLLYGSAQVGKSALIASLPRDIMGRVIVIDPFEDVTPRVAAEIRRSMDIRAQQYLVAARSLDRKQLGAVRRIAWRFTSVRVPPLANRVIKRIISSAVAESKNGVEPIPAELLASMAELCLGRPGVALSLAASVNKMRERKGFWPSAGAAYVDARIRDWQRESTARSSIPQARVRINESHP